MKILNFKYKIPATTFVFNKIKAWVYKKNTKRGLPIFLRGNDIISISPLIAGVYEPQIKSLIDYSAKEGYSDFLVDIGANIGLTLCQSGEAFKVIHAYEPNLLCCKLIEVNSSIALHNDIDIHIHPFGLGEHDVKSVLNVPKNNWGGAYISDKSNRYSSDTLLKKDGYSKYDSTNYIKLDVVLKQARIEFSTLFSGLLQDKLTSGVIKIDVEGFELVVLQAIAETLPRELELVIIFESWGNSINLTKFNSSFQERATLMNYTQERSFSTANLISKALSLFFNNGYEYKLLKLTDGDTNQSDMVMIVNNFSKK